MNILNKVLLAAFQHTYIKSFSLIVLCVLVTTVMLEIQIIYFFNRTKNLLKYAMTFSINTSISQILTVDCRKFRHGKMYSYHIQKYDVPSFVSFAQDWYKNVKPEKVPLPKSMFDDFLALVYDYIRQIPLWYQGLLMIIFFSGFGLSFTYIMFPSLFQKRKVKPEKKKGKKLNKDK